ncbi:DUF6966 domain-containing protein [Paraburkholderia caribensis]|uniref:DUF6966 domain-containing protein n=1 Tax=Paraburkholderia caribensis TaxID=75105 RepID=UPI00071F1762|nr:hypothetical protein [Paraburkholderia caribensis]ALP68634.1 hypothetical protein AN416_38695 [Paraburkholderia caribensis]AUT57992.1 hypothetical protein C2L66_39735 [Paraburkholderia caribensis]
MNKLTALDQLIEALEKLVALLVLDPGCQWTRKFKSDLVWARQLRAGPVAARGLADLSSSIRHVYGGMGSFNDYAPAAYESTTGRYTLIPGTEDFDMVRSEVFDLALTLIATEP